MINTTLESLLSWCEREVAWVRETTEALVRLESPSATSRIQHPPGLSACGEELVLRLVACGAHVDRPPAAYTVPPVRAVFQGDAPQVLLLGHFDTVWPTGQIDRMPIREESGRLYGPGIYDMKAGIAVSMLAIRALDACDIRPRPRVVMLWTTDEETGSAGCRPVLEEEAKRSAAVLVLEPSLLGGAAKTARKGCGEFTVTVRGVASHAGLDPIAGASAIHELARQILEIEKLQDLSAGISVNVGLISGGSRPNVVADEARATVDVRVPTTTDADRLLRAMGTLTAVNPRTRVEVEGGFDRPPLERTADVRRLYGLARDVAEELGQELLEGFAGGGSDGNFTAALGVPTLDGLGPQGDGAHALHEHVLISDLAWRAALLGGLLHRLALAEQCEPNGQTR